MVDSCLRRNDKKMMHEWQMDSIKVIPAKVMTELGLARIQVPRLRQNLDVNSDIEC